jgi:hypothetical protein
MRGAPWTGNRIGRMAKKAKPRKPPHENPIQRVAEEVEERFFEGAELATATTSPETNVLLAAEAAIVGNRQPKSKGEAQGSDARSKRARSKKR